jgi:hypothetical protein
VLASEWIAAQLVHVVALISVALVVMRNMHLAGVVVVVLVSHGVIGFAHVSEDAGSSPSHMAPL